MDTDTTNTYRNPVIDDVNGRYTGVQDVKLVYQPFGKTVDLNGEVLGGGQGVHAVGVHAVGVPQVLHVAVEVELLIEDLAVDVGIGVILPGVIHAVGDLNTADDGVYDGGWVNAVVNSKGYVVAAVVMGEAEGVSDNYAYIKSGAYAEEKVGSDHFCTRGSRRPCCRPWCSRGNCRWAQRRHDTCCPRSLHVADALEGVSGKQFKGHIAAVLNGSGAAEWVVFYDETPRSRTRCRRWG